MYNGMWYQAVLFAVFFSFGVVCGVVFDAFRVSERVKRSCLFVLVVKDIVFWLAVTVFMFAICLKFNNGEIRFFMFVAMFFGATLYFGTISRFVIAVMLFVATVIKKLLSVLVVIPLRFLLRLVNKPVFIALSFSKKSLSKAVGKICFKLKVLKKFKR